MLLLPPHPSRILDPSLIVMLLQALRDHRAAPLLSATTGDSSYSPSSDYLWSSSSTACRSRNASSTVVVPRVPSQGHARFSSQPLDPDGYLTDQASPIPCYGGNSQSYVRQWANPYGGHPSSRYGGRYKRQSQVPHEVPHYIFQQGYPPAQPMMGSRAATSVVSSIDGSSAPLCSLLHADSHSASASDLTAFFAPGPPVSGAPGNPAFGLGHLPIPGQIPPQAQVPQTAPVFPAVHVPMMAPTLPAVAPAAPFPSAVAPPMPALPPLPPAAPTAARVELLKLDPIKDAKTFLDSFETIQYYLRMPEFSTRHADGSLSTDAANLDASCTWEGQLCLAVKDGALRFLFEYKGTQYHSQGFEMLAALTQHCRPDTVSNAFSSLLSHEEFTWDGDKTAFRDLDCNLIRSVGLYPSPSCCHAQVSFSTNNAPLAFCSISLPTSITRLINKLSLSPTAPLFNGRLRWWTLGPRTTCSRTNLPSSPTRLFLAFRFAWATIRTSRFLVVAQHLLPSTENASLFGTASTYLALPRRSTVSVHICISPAVVSWHQI
jgi:hypothetical protein